VVDAPGAAVQALFTEAVAAWRESGVKVVGVVAEAHGLADRSCGAGFLRDIQSGRPFTIYLQERPAHTSCHLDADGVNAACAMVRRQIPGSDLVVLSKFGKLEAMGSGLADAFHAAIAAGKPILTSVSDKHRDTWRVMMPDATSLPADHAALRRWWQAARTGRPPDVRSLESI
jgi:nucleoside-triphosphatase THEP1